MSEQTPTDAPRRIGIIGYGAAGRSCAARLSAEPDCRILVVTRTPPDVAPSERIAFAADLDALIAWQPDAIIEAASAEAFTQMVPRCLEHGIAVVPASVGALQSPDVAALIRETCARSGARLVLPAGAVGGLDYIAAAALTGDIAVTYTSRKPPAAWAGELAALDLADQARTQPVTLFEGTAPDAAKLYPKNLNAGLTIALAAGFDRTRVQVIADPAVARNTHEIAISGAAGDAFLRFENHPSPDNPKTSAITALSLVSTVLRLFEPCAV
ncbi:aspartate dehydrogenase [Aurantimonas sp. A2-1-M11]|uniref:aspartate dehydrogenase n=1 Tax=Aurantimonas sp. A2-1-M11 TaxID=3113712 RepID=UPI002F946985